MEISKIILSRALKESRTTSKHKLVDDLLQKLKAKGLEDIINGDKIEEISKIDFEIRNIIFTDTNLKCSTDEERIDEFAKIIYTQNNYLKEGILNSDIKSILIFLSVNCYFKIEIRDLLIELNLSEGDFSPLLDKIVQLLRNIKLETFIPSNAPYHEKKLMEEFKEGFTTNNIKSTYNLIEAIERSGRGFQFNYLLEQLISFLFQLDPKCFINLLSTLEQITSFIYYLKNIEPDDLLLLANDSTLKSKWLNFELIRQIIAYHEKISNEQDKYMALKSALKKIYNYDFEYLKQTIKYFHSVPLFNGVLGEVITSFKNSEIEEIVNECFEIDQYSYNIVARDELLLHFEAKSTLDQYTFFLNIVFRKWETFFISLFNSKDFYNDKLLLTDFINFIINYYTTQAPDDDIIQQMNYLIKKIKYLDTEWAISQSYQLTKYHLYHSKLYLLTFVFKNKKLNNVELTKKYTELSLDKVQISKYFRDINEIYFDRAIENLNHVNRPI